MKWYTVVSIFFCMILTGCSKKIHESVEVVKDNETQSTIKSYSDDFREVTEMIYADSAFFCEVGHSVPPSLSPSGVFHGSDVAPRRGAPSKGLRPVLIRRKVERGATNAAGTRGAFYREKDVKVTDKKEVKQDYMPAIFRWLAFVGIICLFVYFICITSRT